MLKNCSNCGGKLQFSPLAKGNVCENCGSVFPIKYNYIFTKKPFEENVNTPKVDELAESMQSMKCSSCGANIMLSKFQLQSTCPYCGSTTINKTSKKKLMYIDSIIPFAFNKQEAVNIVNSTVRKRLSVNKKVFKGLSVDDITGVYCNAFVFDISTISTYSGVFSYTTTVKDKDGNTQTEVHHKSVSGEYNKKFQNLTIEANSNLEQPELFSIMPFDYASAVMFNDNFMHGYMLEYQDKMFNECVKSAERVMENAIKRDLLRDYNCEQIVTLTLDTQYYDKKYNYCLLPVYIINRVVDGKKYKCLMNGQTGKMGKLPKNKWRIFLFALLISLGIVGVILLIMFLM